MRHGAKRLYSYRKAAVPPVPIITLRANGGLYVVLKRHYAIRLR
jgi:acetyl-CoA carboxylase carboxyltransferase component